MDPDHRIGTQGFSPGDVALSQSPTVTTPAATRMGVIMGTAAFMGPKQAKGRPVDKRADLWAFGCVLYELLTGTRAFAGEDISDTLAAVLRGEPDWTAIPGDVPASIRALVQGCLNRDRKQRIGDVSTALFLLSDPLTSTAPPLASVKRPQPLWQRAIPRITVAVLAGILGIRHPHEQGVIHRDLKPANIKSGHSVPRFSAV